MEGATTRRRSSVERERERETARQTERVVSIAKCIMLMQKVIVSNAVAPEIHFRLSLKPSYF